MNYIKYIIIIYLLIKLLLLLLLLLLKKGIIRDCPMLYAARDGLVGKEDSTNGEVLLLLIKLLLLLLLWIK